MSFQLIGEDRSFGGNNLFVDLIPRSCWFSNVRTCIIKTDWDKLRKYVYERVDYICECCLINTNETNINGNLEAHERWEYDDINKIQKLKRIVALCHQCHQVTHIGLAKIKGKKDEAVSHLKKVRNFNDIDCEMHIKNAFSLWSERNKYDWTLDLSLIENNNIKLINRKENRKSSSNIYSLEDLKQQIKILIKEINVKTREKLMPKIIEVEKNLIKIVGSENLIDIEDYMTLVFLRDIDLNLLKNCKYIEDI